jgi:hypothetical protein
MVPLAHILPIDYFPYCAFEASNHDHGAPLEAFPAEFDCDDVVVVVSGFCDIGPYVE